MTDFLSRITAEDPPEPREITIGGERGTVWFRKISAGERRKLLEGNKIQHQPGAGNIVEIDLGTNEKERQMLVMFSLCREDGKRQFKTLQEVEAIPHRKFKVLASAAEEFNRDIEDDEDGLGKD